MLNVELDSLFMYVAVCPGSKIESADMSDKTGFLRLGHISYFTTS